MQTPPGDMHSCQTIPHSVVFSRSALSRCFSIRFSFGFGASTEPPAPTLSWRGRFVLGSPLAAGTETRGELTACFSI